MNITSFIRNLFYCTFLFQSLFNTLLSFLATFLSLTFRKCCFKRICVYLFSFVCSQHDQLWKEMQKKKRLRMDASKGCTQLLCSVARAVRFVNGLLVTNFAEFHILTTLANVPHVEFNALSKKKKNLIQSYEVQVAMNAQDSSQVRA